jgi:hypothetical protein
VVLLEYWCVSACSSDTAVGDVELDELGFSSSKLIPKIDFTAGYPK